MNSRERERTRRRRVSASEWADKQDAGWEPTSVKLPDKVERFQVKATGKYKLDILPYVAGDLNPDADNGFEINSLRFFVHWVPTLDGKNKSYCCTAQVFGKPCAVCDYVKENRDMDEQLRKDLKAKTRMLWNVIDLDDKDRKIKIWETAYWKSFGEMLKDAVKDTPEFANFDDPEKGLTVRITVKDSTSGFGKFEIARVDLVPREEQYKQSIIDKAHCLDEMLVKPDYDEIKDLLEGKPAERDEEDDEDEEPTRNGRARAEEEDDEDEPEEPSDIEDEDDEEEEAPAKGKKRRQEVDEEEDEEEEPSDLEDEDEDEESSETKEDPDDDWDDDDSEEDDIDSDEDSEDDESDEEERRPSKKKKKPPVKAGKKKSRR